jgi:hypothetical protein
MHNEVFVMNKNFKLWWDCSHTPLTSGIMEANNFHIILVTFCIDRDGCAKCVSAVTADTGRISEVGTTLAITSKLVFLLSVVQFVSYC